MTEDLYRKLAVHLDNLPGGFPPTDSGVELRLLRRLFTPEEAQLALCLTLISEPPRVIARRAGISTAQSASRLEEMARKGLIFRTQPKGKDPEYSALQFVIGIWEFHVNQLDLELIRDLNEYVPTLLNPEIWKKSPQLRTIPVHSSISARPDVLPYEKAEEMVRSQEKFLVAPCICRREHKMAGKGCDRPEEACLVFGAGADYYQRNGIGRVIGLQETLDILKLADESGLVLQPGNAQQILNICCCCGCCCQVLKNLKRYPKPASLFATAFVAEFDPEACEGCGVCVERCQMQALQLDGGKAVLDRDRCIGCGLCVATCPTESLQLARKIPPGQVRVPQTIVSAAIQLGRERGKLTTLGMAGMVLKSKLDRLLAAKE